MIKTIFQVILVVITVSVINDEIIKKVALDISVISVVKNYHFWTRTLENVFLM